MNWYPRYYGDYTRDTAHLTLAQHGAYTVLLDHYYATGRPLPDALDVLQRICRAFTDAERDAVALVADEFFPVNGDGQRHNARADRELAKEGAIINAKRKAGKAGAEARWGQEGDGICHGTCHASANGKTMAEGMAKRWPSTSTSTSTSTEEPPEGDCKGGTASAAPVSPGEPGDISALQLEAEQTVAPEQVAEWIPCTAPGEGTRKTESARCRRASDPIPKAAWEYGVPESWIAEWEDAYPDVDVRLTLREIRQVVRDKGKWIKTPNGMRRFVGGWIEREQNGGR